MEPSSPTISGIQAVKKIFLEIPNVTFYTLGGTYLQELFPIKQTKNIDFVSVSTGRRAQSKTADTIIRKLDLIGYSYLDGTKNPWRFEARDPNKSRIDIFIQKVSDFSITNTILNRVRDGRLAYEDFVFLKIQTTRDDPKDVGDIIFLLKNIDNSRFRWNVFFEEVRAQLLAYSQKEDKEVVLRRVIEIGYKLEQIQEEEPFLISPAVMKQMDKIYLYFESLVKGSPTD